MLTAAKVLCINKKKQAIFKLLALLKLLTHLWPDNTQVPDGSTYDFIVVGGGTSGCIVASRLAKYNAKVLLVEAGGKPTLETQWPGEFIYLKGSEFDWNFTPASDDCCNSREHIPKIEQGKVLGGSSQVNYMFYGVGNPRDYDEWAKMVNDSSWNYKNVLPFIKRTEKLTDEVILNSSDIIYHGTKGKIKIKKYHSELNTCYFESYKELGYKVVDDINPKTPVGYTANFFMIGDGLRQNTAYKFLSPEKDNPNLHVMYESLVTKIVFDKNQAIGVKILTKDKKLITVHARKEIIICAGVIKSPQLLMLSGIGPETHLKKKDIKVISNLPVGKNLQDTPTSVMAYKMGEIRKLELNPHEFVSPLIHGYAAINKSQNYPDYETYNGVLESTKMLLEICAAVFSLKPQVCDRINKATLNRERYYLVVSLLNAKSRGEILLKTTDPKDQPIIHLGRYTEEEDLYNHAIYVENYNKILDTKYFKSVNAELVDPELEACKGLERGTNAYWKCYVKGMATSLYNYVGTCSMGSVVDSRLRVKGVTGLRVVDASVIPRSVGAAVQASVMVVAQKATDILIQDHKLCN